MDVLFINTPEHPPLGADTWIHVQIIKQLDRRSHRAHVAYLSGEPGPPTPTAMVLREIPDLTHIDVILGPERPRELTLASLRRLALTSWAGVRSMIQLTRFIRSHDVSIIHTSDRPRDAVATVLLARLTGAKSIVHVHVVFSSWMSRPLRWAIMHADARVAVSDFVRGTLVRAGAPPNSTFTVLNAIEPSAWVPRRDRDQVRRRLSIPDDAPVVVTVCRLFEEKGPGALIEAMAQVRQELHDAQLLVVGSDPSADGSFLRALERSVEELNLGGSVRFLGQRSDVDELMAASDVFAMPSFEEPFGLVFCEAAAMELPVVALDNGGTREVVVHGETGLLSERGDVEQLADDITRLLTDDNLRRRLGKAGRRRVEERFATERLADEMACLYRLIASGEGERVTQAGGE